MRKYDLRCGVCGSSHNTSYFFLMLRLLLKGNLYVKCSNCGYVSSYRFIGHIVNDSLDVKAKEYNKRKVWNDA